MSASDEMAKLTAQLAVRRASRAEPRLTRHGRRPRAPRLVINNDRPISIPENRMPAVEADAPRAAARKRVHISDEALAYARQKPRRRGLADAPTQIFRFPAFPQAAMPTDPEVTMAQDSAVASLNTWANAQLGGGYVGMSFFEGQMFMGYTYLGELAQRPEYRKFAERTASEMTRKWIRIIATGDGAEGKEQKIKAIEAYMKKLKVRDLFREIAEMDAFFGRAHLWMDFGDNTEAELLMPIGDGNNDISELKVGRERPLRRLQTVEPLWCYPMAYNSNDPLKADWYRPQQWYVMARPVHTSRLLTFVGREVPDILKPAYAFGGLALSQEAKPYVDNWLRTRQSVSDILHAFSVSGILTDLSEVLSPAGGELFKRIDMLNLLKDNRGALVLDKATEEFFQFNTPLSTLDDLQAQAQEQMASVVNMPLVIMLGTSPKGLNASSEGELRVWYDWVGSCQERLFAEKLTRLIGFIQLSLYDEVDPEITFAFEPLWSMSAKEMAELQKAQADADVAYCEGGILNPEEVRRSLAADPSARYAGLDVYDVPEMPDQDQDQDGTGVGLTNPEAEPHAKANPSEKSDSENREDRKDNSDGAADQLPDADETEAE